MMITRRNFSSLASKIRDAVSTESGRTGGSASVIREGNLDAKGEEFHEMFVMPKRKLRAQMELERITGRSQIERRSRMDIHDRLAVRSPRSNEMETDQEWSSVWPAARSFASSVVPLPIRMGSRKNPDKRAPFKKEGNLELVKIPNFLHLTPAAIEKHCNALKQFCTEFPAALKGKEVEALPLTVKYADFIHQGTNIRDNRARVITVSMKVSSLALNDNGKEKLMRLAGSRYNEETDTLTIVTDRCYTRDQNYDYAFYLLTVLYHESNKVDSWESMKGISDRLNLVFEGSTTDERLNKAIAKTGLSPEEAKEKKEKFKQIWTKYVNTEESAESTREYAAAIKDLLANRRVEDRV